MQLSWLVLMPPLLVLLVSYTTHRVLLSLFVGICAGSLLVAKGSLLKTVGIIAEQAYRQLDVNNLYIFSFLTALGILITLMSYTGGTAAYGALIKTKLKNARSAETASILLSCLLLFDDFFSSITTGCIMRPLTDHFNIPRAKLAFLIDSMAAPLVILVPVSSWIAMLTMQIAKSGISNDLSDNPLLLGDPFNIYMHIIPFIFYSFLIVMSVVVIVRCRISFGIMKCHENIAAQTGNLYGGKPSPTDPTSCGVQNGELIDFALPISLLLISVGTMLLYAGNARIFGGTNTLITALQQTDIFFALFSGSLITLIATLMYYLALHKIPYKIFPSLLKEGSELMASSIAILFLAWMFSRLLINDLNSGAYLASLFNGTLPIPLLPVIFFIIATITSIAIGSSWGTIAVLVPLATPMITQLFDIAHPISALEIPLLFPLLGAIFAGAVAGDHVSPLSSTTVMSATSAGVNYIDHVQTQFQYALPALIGTAASFLLAGYICNYGFLICWIGSLSCGVVVTLCVMKWLISHTK